MGFRFRLEAVQKVQEFKRDAEKQTLAELLAQQEELAREEIALRRTLEKTLQERSASFQLGTVNAVELQPFLQFEARLRRQLATLADERKWLLEQVEKQRENLLVSEREVKKFEKLEEKQREEYQKKHSEKG